MTPTSKVKNLYVSHKGNDLWSGTLAEVNAEGTDGPLATLHGARNKIRSMKFQQSFTQPVTVHILPGTYPLDRPFVLEKQDSGTATCPITYGGWSEGKKKPLISGGKRITGWERGPGRMWQVFLPEVLSCRWHFRQLFVDGRRRHRVRVPSKGYYWVEEEVPGNRSAFIFKPGQIDAAWTNLQDVEILTYMKFSESRLSIARIEEIEKNGQTISICHCAREVSRQKTRHFKMGGGRYVVENVFEQLNQPGQWYLNRKTGMLYYIPCDDEDMHEAVVIAPWLDHLVNLKGDIERRKYIRHVTFRDLRFSYSGADFPEYGYGEEQADLFVRGAIRADGAHECTVSGCELSRMGTYAIELRRGCCDNLIEGNALHDLGAGGIKIGEPHAPSNDDSATEHNEITDNIIRDGGLVYIAGVGVWVGHSGDNTISHNEICDLYSMGISVGWTWAEVFTRARNNTITYNHIHHLGKGETGSSSGVYLLSRQPGTIVRNNLIHDLIRHPHEEVHPTFGIQVDNGGGDMCFEHNIIYNVSDACYKQMGKNHVVRNNIFAFANGYEMLRRKRQEGTGIFRHNIIYSKNGLIFGDTWTARNCDMDENLYWDTSVPAWSDPDRITEHLDFGGMSFEQWQIDGRDANSVIADPIFENTNGFDFTLHPDSPAYCLGFAPIDMSMVGPTGTYTRGQKNGMATINSTRTRRVNGTPTFM